MDVSFGHFIGQLGSNPAMLITTLLTIGVIFVNGWTDAPNAIATCISTRCMGVRPAILMSALFNFLGVFIMTNINSSVVFTISEMVDFGGNSEEALVALCAALFSIVVYSTGASWLGIPTSESHSLIAGLTGAAIAIHNGLGGINFSEWAKVLYGLVLSLALGVGSGWACCKLVTWSSQFRPEEGEPLLPLGADSRRGGDELHARRAGRPEVHRRPLPRPRLLQRQRRGEHAIPVWLMLSARWSWASARASAARR